MGFLGAMFFALGVLTLLRGRQYYHNYWGGAVFAPFAMLIGGLCFFVLYAKRKAHFSSIERSTANGTRRKHPTLVRINHDKVGRNALCPCGSGLKTKHCCLSKNEEHELQEHGLDQRQSVDVMEGPGTTFRRAFDRFWKPPKA
jgi:hypothetical protein